MENYIDQSHTVHVELDGHRDSIIVAVAFHASRTNALEVIGYSSVCELKITHCQRPTSLKCIPRM